MTAKTLRMVGIGLVLGGVAIFAYHAPDWDLYRYPCETWTSPSGTGTAYCRTFSREWLVGGLVMIVGGAFAYREGTRKKE